MKSGERFVEGEGNQRGSRWVREKKAAAFNSETGDAVVCLGKKRRQNL
jgi:hypothetical protein